MLHLPSWVTDYAKRHDPTLGEAPLAFYERIKGGLRVAALDGAAARFGVRIGQSLADARSIAPQLLTREIDHQAFATAFAEFADWHSNASPLVAVHTDCAPYGDLVLDITGVEHLFGGEAAMLNQLTQRLAQLGYHVRGAIGSTIGLAWATAHFSPGAVISEGRTHTFLDALPVAALRLTSEQTTGLMQMGLKQIGQVRERPRKPLQARFGASLLVRLDQAYGAIEERLVPRLPAAERYAERRFADPIALMDDVLMTAHDLAVQLACHLETAGEGAQAFHLFLYRVDHKVMTLSVNSGRATRDPAHIARLFKHRSERLIGEYDAGFGIDIVRLAASSISSLEAAQLTALQSSDASADLEKLLDRMSSRLGVMAVLRSCFANTHQPEQAVVLEPVVARTPDDPATAPDQALIRPLRLLPRPEPITVTAQVPDGPPALMVWRRVSYRFTKAAGPERIAPEWWRSGRPLQLVPNAEPSEPDRKIRDLSGLPAPTQEALETPPYLEGADTRDYYLAEDETGRRFWLFRQGLYEVQASPLWYLHGFFP
ncbi:Y-family DNA polymerase [Devosia sp. RR2S18]|uniref:Y-family DNA polymerase n=1 Tax=Devosia rhizosphaerae TaxID=3049774 RepID=UPI002541BAE8|nr:DNA polymerase Y family protein [Devosia sp. RR2S18]WIJ25523.1 DNA polymerase Y family protein [Devosia sp. RR2S18]